MLEEGEGDEEAQRPDYRLRDLRLDAWREGRPGLDHPPEVGWHFDKLLEAIRGPLRIGDVAGEERRTAVELEIELAAVRLRLRKELHASVLPGLRVVLRSQTAHVEVLDAEAAVNAAGVMEQPGGGLGAVVAALRPEVLNLQGLGLHPNGVWPQGVQRGNGVGDSNSVFHTRYSKRCSGALERKSTRL